MYYQSFHRRQSLMINPGLIYKRDHLLMTEIKFSFQIVTIFSVMYWM
jgi:hypothetical protein